MARIVSYMYRTSAPGRWRFITCQGSITRASTSNPRYRRPYPLTYRTTTMPRRYSSWASVSGPASHRPRPVLMITPPCLYTSHVVRAVRATVVNWPAMPCDHVWSSVSLVDTSASSCKLSVDALSHDCPTVADGVSACASLRWCM